MNFFDAQSAVLRKGTDCTCFIRKFFAYIFAFLHNMHKEKASFCECCAFAWHVSAVATNSLSYFCFARIKQLRMVR